ncbi:VOC family protein [Nannocystis pusilla]|uniref:VOC family protein n=1 Tax=Nannocystis pusilla TaxID=889268 RepID=A0A9X3ES25_9BACT|nr:VOC family protein [Nannocystis pusilla]MCY1008885.1 VOC family protein [Nannocystis pusilla]
MLTALRNRTIAAAFTAWTAAVRARRVLASLGRPRLRLLDHVTIPVTDLAAARRFYCDVLGGVFLMEVDAAALARFGRPPAPDDGDGTFHVSLYLGGATRVDLFLQRDGQRARCAATRTTPSAWPRATCRASRPASTPTACRPMARCSSASPARPRSTSTIRPATCSS